MCKPKEGFSFIRNWYSYILRGTVIASPSGIVVVLFVVVSEHGGAVGSILCLCDHSFFVPHVYYLF